MIKILDGNLFDTDAEIICHQCNCQGVMGSRVAAEVKRRYPNVYRSYRDTYEQEGLKLGDAIIVPTYNDKEQVIANLCAQDKYGRDKQYTDYKALRKCLEQVRLYAFHAFQKCKIAFPYGMGSVRGGGDWNTVYQIIDEELGQYYDVEIWRLDKG